MLSVFSKGRNTIAESLYIRKTVLLQKNYTLMTTHELIETKQENHQLAATCARKL